MLTAASWVTWKTERTFFDAQTEAMYRDLEARLPGYEMSFTSSNKAEDKFIVATFSDRTRGKRYLYDRVSKSLEFLRDVAPWLPESELAVDEAG